MNTYKFEMKMWRPSSMRTRALRQLLLAIASVILLVYIVSDSIPQHWILSAALPGVVVWQSFVNLHSGGFIKTRVGVETYLGGCTITYPEGQVVLNKDTVISLSMDKKGVIQIESTPVYIVKGIPFDSDQGLSVLRPPKELQASLFESLQQCLGKDV